MLSYQHGFHAGNAADVLKHTVWCHVLSYLTGKDKPLYCHDTHAGRGLYDLQAPMAAKTAEYAGGIARAHAAANPPPAVAQYLAAVQAFNPDGRLRWYPGSGLLAQHLLRPTDRIVATELHPQEFEALALAARGRRNLRPMRADGFAALKAALPPPERRGVVLLDPSYETTADDAAVIEALQQALRRFATGTYLVWYPVVVSARAAALVRRVAALPVSRLLQVEWRQRQPVAGERGLVGSGMLVINPPWTLAAAMQDAMPWLAQHLGLPGEPGSWCVDTLVADSAPTA